MSGQPFPVNTSRLKCGQNKKPQIVTPAGPIVPRQTHWRANRPTAGNESERPGIAGLRAGAIPAYNVRMSRSRKNSPLAFWLTVMAGLLMLYVLLLGPVDGLQSGGWLPEPIASAARWFYAPLSWAIAHAPEPVHKVFYNYVRFWVELFKR